MGFGEPFEHRLEGCQSEEAVDVGDCLLATTELAGELLQLGAVGARESVGTFGQPRRAVLPDGGEQIEEQRDEQVIAVRAHELVGCLHRRIDPGEIDGLMNLLLKLADTDVEAQQIGGRAPLLGKQVLGTSLSLEKAEVDYFFADWISSSHNG